MTQNTQIDKALNSVSSEEADNYDSTLVLTKEQLASINHFVEEKLKLDMAKTTLTDDIKGFAKAHSIRVADVNDMIKVLIKDREKGAQPLIDERERRLENARQIVEQLGVKNN
jgi:hypothetical protein